jgi:NAD(P)-dependent dehydrogenase (short-subunit alcohol dehydrogenase family)
MITHADQGLRASDRTVLLVGATGAFGERLAEGLIRSGIAVIGVARNEARLDLLARRLGPGLTIELLDRAGIDTACLLALRGRWPGLFAVADASGPFQTSDDRLPRAAIGAGLHYVDLADARAFVGGIRHLDEQARAANVAVLAGASSTPALSHAVLDTLVAGSRKVIAIEVSIAPGNRAPRGLSTVQAVLSTVGRPIRVFRGGRWTEEVGWGLNKTIELPGVGKRRVALCETRGLGPSDPPALRRRHHHEPGQRPHPGDRTERPQGRLETAQHRSTAGHVPGPDRRIRRVLCQPLPQYGARGFRPADAHSAPDRSGRIAASRGHADA